MTKPMIRIHNAETNEIIDREMNDLEFAQYEADKLAETTRIAETEAKATAKETAQAKLTALGLTVDDLKALGL